MAEELQHEEIQHNKQGRVNVVADSISAMVRIGEIGVLKVTKFQSIVVLFWGKVTL